MPLRQRKTWFWRNNSEEPATENEDVNTSASSSSTASTIEERASEKAKEKLKSKSIFSSRKCVFPLGIFLGTVVSAIIIAPSTGPLEMPTQLGLLLEQSQTDLGAFFSSVFPVIDLDWGRFESEWEAFKSRIPEPWKLNNDGREFRVGEHMRDRGLRANYPVVLIPGIISTGLESWSTSDEYRGWFREKVWGGLHMISQVTFNRDKWMASVLLDAETGLDPPGVKVRAAQGIDAASSFIQGYWIWSKIVENLAVVGYDTNNLLLAAYDWRLSYWNLEERDGYFSRLKASIEEMRKRHDKKVVLVAHSMGSTVVLYFFKWVESPRFGGGGPTWVEDHIESFISAAGTHLGVPKAMAAFLSGEMRDTVEINPTGAYVLERFFSRKERARLFRSWAGSASMWIKGGDAIWGNHTHAPDDYGNCTQSHGSFFSFRPTEILGQNANDKQNEEVSLTTDTNNMTAEEAGTWILEHTPVSFQKMMATNYSCGIERDEKKLKLNDDDPTKWSNPLESRLPDAPSMKIFCAYGHGKDTERAYWYARGEYEYDETSADAENAVRNGVKIGEGDGTVSLLSLGAMCAEGWKRKRWNPAGIKVTTIELPHLPTPSIPRGGANTSDHVDILGSTGLNELIVKVATGAGGEIKDMFVSSIREYAQHVQWD
ncbi:hypothetical protein EW145_g3711 [Phellinidium pouzarii]|uniref:Phospholipid:diacylglycerol acyltransferase n=1 Tax=Phellinidium pouzarii TaxID=167371 RepID=A0A4S4L6C6_9AGAM|nr:hypothetical protein EW145_g3711 [Phellinidium pouzarii]